MARAIRHWAESTQILTHSSEGHQITKIGRLIFNDSGDRYLERKDTLWLLHYLIVSQASRNGLWYYLFNTYPSDHVVKHEFLQMVEAWVTRHGSQPLSIKTIERDFLCCMNMYSRKETDTPSVEDLLTSPFKDLRLISGPHDQSSYRLRRVTGQELSPLVFAFALLDFWEDSESDESISVDQILHDAGSPGRIFRLSEDALSNYLELIERLTRGKLIFDRTAGVQQVLKVTDARIKPVGFLVKLYKTHGGMAAE